MVVIVLVLVVEVVTQLLLCRVQRVAMDSGDRIESGDGQAEEDESDASDNDHGSGDFEEEEEEDGNSNASDSEGLDDSNEKMVGVKKNFRDGVEEEEDNDDYNGTFEEVIVREPTVLLSCLGIGFSNVNRKVT